MADNPSKSSQSGTASDSTKKSATKSTRKTPAKQASAKKSDTPNRSSTSRKRAPSAEPGRTMSGSQVAEAAVRQLSELTSKDVEGVTALQKDDDGWQVDLEVVELRRIPTTTDVLATYEVMVDTSGELQGYRRVRRYVRGQAEDGS